MTAAVNTKLPLQAGNLNMIELTDDELLEVSGGSVLVYLVRTKAMLASAGAAMQLSKEEFISWFLANTDQITQLMLAISTTTVFGFVFGGEQAAIFRGLSESDRREIAEWSWDSVHKVVPVR